MPLLIYFVTGTLFGIVITKAEVNGIFATAIPTAIVTVQALKRLKLRTLGGQPIAVAPKIMGTGARYALGGTTFGLGWALTGACPGPLFALVGAGVTVLIAAIASALAGTWLYGRLRHILPH
ncbi:MAG: DUF6691 family protein [Vicinamibacterales bacterium]